MEVDIVIRHRSKWDEKKEPDGFIIEGNAPQATDTSEAAVESKIDEDDDIIICEDDDLRAIENGKKRKFEENIDSRSDKKAKF